MKSFFSDYIRGFNTKKWYHLYTMAGKNRGFIKTLLTALYMKMASNNGGYIGRETIIKGEPILPHGFHGIHISRGATIGTGVTIYQNVTIGAGKDGAPIIGNNVYIGAGAIIVGGGKIGNNVKIGAGAIVIGDVPDNCTVVSEKSKIIQR